MIATYKVAMITKLSVVGLKLRTLKVDVAAAKVEFFFDRNT